MSKVVLALALVAAACGDLMDRENYDDSPGDMELMYPDQSYVDMMPEPEPGLDPPASMGPPLQPTTQPRRHEDPTANMRRILTYKMLMALRNHDASPSFLSGPKWIPTNTELIPPDTVNLSHLKGPVGAGALFKRYSPGEGSIKGAQLHVRPQQKWKIKKGKAGSHIICYFKLCAFRPSS